LYCQTVMGMIIPRESSANSLFNFFREVIVGRLLLNPTTPRASRGLVALASRRGRRVQAPTWPEKRIPEPVTASALALGAEQGYRDYQASLTNDAREGELT
jgi:hypothetical protein